MEMETINLQMCILKEFSHGNKLCRRVLITVQKDRTRAKLERTRFGA